MKSNLGPLGAGLVGRVEQTIVGDGIVASRLVWTGEKVTRSADEVLRALDGGTDERQPVDAAEEFLREALAVGERSTTDLQAEAKDAGHAWATVRRAQNHMRIKPYQRERRWYWRMPAR